MLYKKLKLLNQGYKLKNKQNLLKAYFPFRLQSIGQQTVKAI